MKNNKTAPSAIVLFAKQGGKTSFSSLYTIKHALSTTKVGHTGTLDSFAEGLLVVLTGGMTRLVPYITAFDKTYEAVIAFGSETDTLDPSGTVVKKAALPTVTAVKEAVACFRGKLRQTPPEFSAVHIDGKRASDLARSGKTVELPSREITVYDSEILELRENEDGFVTHAHIRFHVSKGTYIRSLARDIALKSGSAAHLAGLLRTKVGSFSLENAAGAGFLKPFTIDRVLLSVEEERAATLKTAPAGTNVESVSPSVHAADFHELQLQQEVRDKLRLMSREVAVECGFIPVTLSKEHEIDYFNGRPLRFTYFTSSQAEKTDTVFTVPAVSGDKQLELAVFTKDDFFAGLLSQEGRKLRYQFVCPRENLPSEKNGGTV